MLDAQTQHHFMKYSATTEAHEAAQLSLAESIPHTLEGLVTYESSIVDVCEGLKGCTLLMLGS